MNPDDCPHDNVVVLDRYANIHEMSVSAPVRCDDCKEQLGYRTYTYEGGP